MSDTVKFVKSEILGCFTDSKADVGHALSVKMLLFQRFTHWNQEQEDALETAANELVTEGILGKNGNDSHFLTQKGVDQLYPPVGNSVRDAVLSCFYKSRAKPGDILDTKALHQHMLHWNPKQKEALDP